MDSYHDGLSTRNVNRGLRCHAFDDIMMTVNQSDSVPERAGEFKHQITLTDEAR